MPGCSFSDRLEQMGDADATDLGAATELETGAAVQLVDETAERQVPDQVLHLLVMLVGPDVRPSARTPSVHR